MRLTFEVSSCVQMREGFYCRHPRLSRDAKVDTCPSRDANVTGLPGDNLQVNCVRAKQRLLVLYNTVAINYATFQCADIIASRSCTRLTLGDLSLSAPSRSLSTLTSRCCSELCCRKKDQERTYSDDDDFASPDVQPKSESSCYTCLLLICRNRSSLSVSYRSLSS